MKIVIVIPAFNEQTILEQSVVKVLSFCRRNVRVDWGIIIVDNGSTDQTQTIGKKLAGSYNEITYLRLSQPGKGAAIKAGWQSAPADSYIFMDADLATDLSALLLVIKELQNGYDVVIGSRFHPDSKVTRGSLRKFFSRGYRLVIKALLGTKVTDAACGFKAINQKVKEVVLPRVENNQWFFDSELVMLAEHLSFKVKEIPVVWSDPREPSDRSRVKTVRLSLAYFKAVLALRRRLQ